MKPEPPSNHIGLLNWETEIMSKIKDVKVTREGTVGDVVDDADIVNKAFLTQADLRDDIVDALDSLSPEKGELEKTVRVTVTVSVDIQKI